MQRRNVVLIGMPGVGKSTVGVLAAKSLGMSFIDTDLIIQQNEKRLLQDIINNDGIEQFLRIEEAAITNLHAENCVIATGGSVVLSVKSMQHVKTSSLIIYLEIPFAKLEQRINNIAVRGIVIGQGQKLCDVYNERIPMYEAYAMGKIDCSHQSIEDVVQSVCAIVDSYESRYV